MFSLCRAKIPPIFGVSPAKSLGVEETGHVRLIGQFDLPTLFRFALLCTSCGLGSSAAGGRVCSVSVFPSIMNH